MAFAVRRRDLVISAIKIRLRHESGEEKTFSWQGIVQHLAQMHVPQAGLIPWDKELSVLAIKLTPKEVEGRFIRFQEDDYHTKKDIQEGKAAKKLSYLKGKGEYDCDAFLDSEEMKDVFSFIVNWFNWKQGKYTVTFNVESSEAFTLKDNVYEFSLSVLDIELLMANKDMIRMSYEDQCKAGIKEYKPHDSTWNWVNPILKKAT